MSSPDPSSFDPRSFDPCSFDPQQNLAAEIIITKGNPEAKEIAVLTALFTVLSARAGYLNKTFDKWPSPECDAKLRGPNGTYVNTRTNLRWW